MMSRLLVAGLFIVPVLLRIIAGISSTFYVTCKRLSKFRKWMCMPTCGFTCLTGYHKHERLFAV